MHLEVNQRLQEVASYKRDKLFPEEIDMALNKAMYRLLEKGVDTKFEDDQINLSHVSALIKKNRVSEVIIPSSTDPLYEEGILNVYTPVAADLYWLVNGRAEVITDPLNCDTAPSLGTTSLLEFKAIVPFPAANVSAPFFPAVTVGSSVLGNLYTAPSPINAGFASADSQYILIDNILEVLYSHPTLRVYWERYRDTYSKNSFIFVSNSDFGTITVAGTGLTSSVVVRTQTAYTVYNRGAISALPSKTVAISSTKPQEDSLLYSSMRQNQFYRTRSIEPLTVQIHDYFIIYREESFLLTRFYYDYIRKPRTISLLLNQSCELASSTHPKIIDLAVEILRLDTKDQAYPATVQDTQLRTN
jgi:hypothetical protein